ncbi:MAG: hypothetical protein CL912_33360 [Deltaproteobacteria bacterium]|nr:hypothetical protein [Deltaproteobacteria bacterium]
MALVQFAAGRRPSNPGLTPTKATKAKSGHQEHKRRRLQKATPGCYFDTRFSPGQKIIGDSSIIGVQSCLEVRADDDVLTGGRNHQNQDAKLQLHELSPSPQPRIGAHPSHHSQQKSQRHVQFLQPPSNISDDSISIYSTHSSTSLPTVVTNSMDAEPNEMQMRMQLQQHRRRSKTPVFFVGQLERKSVATACELDKAQLLASEYQAVLPLRLKTSFAKSLSQFSELDLDHDNPKALSHRPKTPKRLRKIKCQLSLRDLVKQHSQCGPSPSTPGSDAETLVGSPPCSPLDEDFDKHSHQPLFSPQTQPHDISDEDDELSLPTSPTIDNDIGLKICTELLTNELATALLRHHPAEMKDRASGLQILLMIEAYETVQSQVRRMLYDARVTGKQFGHVREAERILEHWLKALYAVYDREQEEENRMSRLDYAWPLRG